MCNLVCPICRESLSGENLLRICSLPCGHMYHDSCIYDWLESAQTCPHCRILTTTDQIIKLYFDILIDENNQKTDLELITNELAEAKRSIETLNTDLSAKAQGLNSLTKKYIDVTRVNESFRHESKVLNSRIEELKAVISLYQSQKDNLKDRIIKVHKEKRELETLAKDVKKYQKIEELLECSVGDANDSIDSDALDFETLKVCFLTIKKDFKAAVEAETKLKGDYSNLFNAYKKVMKTNADLCERISIKDRIIEGYSKQVHVTYKPLSPEAEMPGPSAGSSREPEVVEQAAEPVRKKRCVLRRSSREIAVARPSASALFNRRSQKNMHLTYDGLGGHSKEERFPNAKLKACRIVSNRRNKI